MHNFLQDLQFALRQMRRNPGFTTAAVLILGVGVGAATAIFSVLNPLLFQSLPYPQAERILMVWDKYQGERSDVTFHTYREVAQRSHTLESAAVVKAWQPTLTGAAEPERLDGQSVSADYFRVLGVAPTLGRNFEGPDDQVNAAKVVVLSNRLWRRLYAGDPLIVGKQIRLNDDAYTVVGVMPASFENVLAPSAELWTPLRYDASNASQLDTREWGHHLHMIARLRGGVSEGQVQSELDAIAQSQVAEFPRPAWAGLESGLILDSLQAEVARGIKPALFAVVAAVALLLLIATVNVANLLLARGMQRQAEFAMRSALGAERSRILRQLLTESLLLAAMAGATGLAVAQGVLRALLALRPAELPRLDAVQLDGPVFAFAAVITAVVGLALGVAPALHLSRGDLHLRIQGTSARTAAGQSWMRGALVVAEVAIALVLLVGAGLLLRSLQHLFAVDPGFDTTHLLTMQVQTAGHHLDDATAKRRFFEVALEAVRRVPGVESAAFTSLLPLSGDLYQVYGTHFEGREDGGSVYRYVVTPEYFQTTGTPLRKGRLLSEGDTANAPRAVLLSESLARRMFGSKEALGGRVHVGPTDEPWYTIVGVVGDVKQGSLADTETDAVYLTPAQTWDQQDAMSLVVRSRADAASLAPMVRRAIWSVDKDQPVMRVATMRELLARSDAQRRFAFTTFQAFAIAALLLAAAGIYSVISGSVTERMREMGIRSALGATPSDILMFVLRQGMWLAVVGVAFGLAAAALGSRVVAALLFGVSRLDPLTYMGVAALLLAVSVIAVGIPARRASQVDPAVTLRAE